MCVRACVCFAARGGGMGLMEESVVTIVLPGNSAETSTGAFYVHIQLVMSYLVPPRGKVADIVPGA